MAFEFELGEVTVHYRCPETTRDVLDFRVWILNLPDEVEQVRHCVRWASRWIISPDEFSDPDKLLRFVLDADEPGQMMLDVIKMCSAIAASAELPPERLKGLAVMLDKQNGIAPDWTPKSPCDCPKCRRGLEVLPPGSRCLYEDAGPLVLDIAHYAGGLKEGAASDPYYLTQIREVQRRAEARMMAHDREEREEKQRYQQVMKRKLGHG